MSLRLRHLSGAVLLSQSARPFYGGMLRALALGCGAAHSRPLVLGAGLGSVGGATSVCAHPRCGTHTPPWSSWGTTAKSLFGLTPRRCPRRAAPSPHGGVLAWMSQTGLIFCFVKEVRVSPLWWSGGWGGAWYPGPAPLSFQLGGSALGCRHSVPQVRSPWRAPVAGTSDGTRWFAGGHRTAEGRRPLSFLRPLPGRLRPAAVVVVCPPRLVAWLPRGAWARFIGSPLPMSGAGAVTPCLQGGSSPHPLFRSLVGCRSPWPRVCGNPSPR